MKTKRRPGAKQCGESGICLNEGGEAQWDLQNTLSLSSASAKGLSLLSFSRKSQEFIRASVSAAVGS